MSTDHVHAGPFMPVQLGRCSYRFKAFGVYLSCDDTTVPGTDWCAEHFIAAVQARPFNEDRP